MNSHRLTTTLWAVLAILAFAANSLLARAALIDGAIDAGAYSVIRLASGALILLPLFGKKPSLSDIPGALALAAYTVAFSIAYLNLSTGSGALILFGSVQACVIILGLIKGERLNIWGWIGLVLALVGLAVVLVPSVEAVGLWPGFMMACAGAAFGFYTMIGRGVSDAVGSTARYFLLATPMVVPLLLLDSGTMPEVYGIVLAVISGTLTSALGYVIWAKVTPRMGISTIASVQLSTPAVAAAGGVLLLSEALSLSLVLGGALILGGVLLTLRKSG